MSSSFRRLLPTGIFDMFSMSSLEMTLEIEERSHLHSSLLMNLETTRGAEFGTIHVGDRVKFLAWGIQGSFQISIFSPEPTFYLRPLTSNSLPFGMLFQAHKLSFFYLDLRKSDPGKYMNLRKQAHKEFRLFRSL